jgi:hypothetical protein
LSSKFRCAFLQPRNEWEAAAQRGPSLDLEIIAQGKADEKDGNDRKKVLKDYLTFRAVRWNGEGANIAIGAEQKFFDTSHQISGKSLRLKIAAS